MLLFQVLPLALNAAGADGAAAAVEPVPMPTGSRTPNDAGPAMDSGSQTGSAGGEQPAAPAAAAHSPSAASSTAAIGAGFGAGVGLPPVPLDQYRAGLLGNVCGSPAVVGFRQPPPDREAWEDFTARTFRQVSVAPYSEPHALHTRALPFGSSTSALD